jgi:uncharacterized membrane protein
MIWQVAILISGLLTGIGQFLGKRQVRHMSAMQSTILSNIMGLIVLGLVVAVSGQYRVWEWSLVLLILFGIVESVAIAAYYSAVRESLSGATVFGYLLSQIIIVIVSFGLFNEWIYFDPSTLRGVVNIASLFMTMMALYAYSGTLLVGRRWIGMITMSAMINAVANIAAKYFLQTGIPPFLYLLVEQVGLLIGGFIYILGRKQGLNLSIRSWKIGLLQGLFAVAGPMIYIYVLMSEPLSLASVVKRLAALMVTVLMGLLFYKERDKMGKRGWISLILGLVAFSLVMIVNR